MEVPGMSLFQGAASIHINNSVQDRLQEQEEIEDQKRRDEELKHKLDNGFDDLIEDDEASSVNSSINYTADNTNVNGIEGPHEIRSNGPPTYIESLNHLKERQRGQENGRYHFDNSKPPQSPQCQSPFGQFGAGDAQKNFFPHDYNAHNGIKNVLNKQGFMNHEELKVMYEMRIQECQQLAGEKQKLDVEIDSLRARLAAAVHDKDKAELSLQEAHHLLASGKHQLVELQHQVKVLSDQLMRNEEEKEHLKLELRSANISLQDVQQKLQNIQVARSHDTDAIFREQQDRHREEIDRLYNDLTKVKNRLEQKESELMMLEKRCNEKDREKERLLIEKGSTINKLAAELEAAQNRLMSGETVKLKEKLSQVTSERNTARDQVKELGSKLETTAHELVLTRSKLASNQKEFENWQSALHTILSECVSDAVGLGEAASPGKLSTLREVLSKNKHQIQKLATLQDEIVKRDKKIEQHRKEEASLRSKINEQKAVETQLNSKLALLQNKLELLANGDDNEIIEAYKSRNSELQNELESARSDYKNLDLKYTELELEYEKSKSEKGGRASIVQQANGELIAELEKLSGKLKETLKENGQLKTLYIQACSERDSVIRELNEAKKEISKSNELRVSQDKNTTESLEKQKQCVLSLTAELASTKEELKEANERISELQKEFTDKQKVFTEKLNKYIEDENNAMQKDLVPCSQCEKNLQQIRFLEEKINNYNLRLATQENNEELMKELRGKAEFFQQYITERFQKLQDQKSVATNTEETVPLQKTSKHEVEADNDKREDDLKSKDDMLMKEKLIRDQIAEKFTLEIKTVEMDCSRKLKEMENEHLTISTKLKELVERKAHEVETLKQFLLAERAKVTQILESKENEITELIKEHNELRSQCQSANDCATAWKLKAERYKEKLSRCSSHEDVLSKEKEEWRQRADSCAKDWHNVKAKTTALQNKMKEIEEKYDMLKSEHKTLSDKYKNAKKMVFTYKEYMAKKDSHITSEISRIQGEYKKIFSCLQNQINHCVNCRRLMEGEAHKTQGNRKNQHDTTNQLNALYEDFTRLKEDYKDTNGLDLNNQ